MITPKQLVAELKCPGITISKRRLTDWRAKDLLPPLTKHGLGRGKGSINVWADRSVVDQAVAIHTQLNQTRRTDDVLLHLFFSGYDVPVERVRSAWVKGLSHFITTTNKSIQKSKGNELAFIEGAMKKLQPKTTKKNNPPDNMSELIREFLEYIFDPKYELESESSAVLIIDALKIKNTDKNYAEIVENYKLAQKTVLSFLKIQDQYELIYNASNYDLTEAQKFIKLWGTVLNHWVALQNREMTDEENYLLSLAQSAEVGQVICLFILFFAQKTSGRGILGALEDWANKGLKLSENDLPALKESLKKDAPWLETFMQKTTLLFNTIDELHDIKF